MTACSEKELSVYFPLAKNIQWRYSTSMIYLRRTIDSKLILENIGSKKYKGNTVYTQLDHNGHKNHFIQNDNFILQNTITDNIENTDSNKESHFVLPVDIKVGDEWQLKSRPYVMEHAIEYEVALQNSTPAIKLSKPLVMSYKVESLDEIVDVPAGRFYQCAKVHGKGTCKMTASGGNFSGSVDVNVEHTSWYCPETGLTKAIRTEYDPGKFLDPVTYRLELESISKM
jgi:hypothetical protein